MYVCVRVSGNLTIYQISIFIVFIFLFLCVVFSDMLTFVFNVPIVLFTRNSNNLLRKYHTPSFDLPLSTIHFPTFRIFHNSFT